MKNLEFPEQYKKRIWSSPKLTILSVASITNQNTDPGGDYDGLAS